MKKIYKCDYCGKIFNIETDCKIHEKLCKKISIKVKAISLTVSDEIMIMEWPNALEWENKINLMPHLKNDMCNNYYKNEIFQFDKIKVSEGGDYIIYTKNFNKDYEELCINKLLDKKIKNLIEYENTVKAQIKYLKNKNKDNIIIERQNNYLVENLY